MPPDPFTETSASPTVEARVDGETLRLGLAGQWRLGAELPEARARLHEALEGTSRIEGIVIDAAAVTQWDSSLALFILNVRDLARDRVPRVELRNVPKAVRELIDALDAVAAPSRRARRGMMPLREWVRHVLEEGEGLLAFFGECILGVGRLLLRPHRFRWLDAVEQMRRCGASALPIVGLISILVGVILGYVASSQLRDVGADIFVADLVGLAVLREMGPMMAAIVLTGRTGAAFAAELGNMKLNEEIDALETFGVRGLDFLVLPRLIALVLMMPLLALYADFLGILGGLVTAEAVLDVTPTAFFIRLQTAIATTDLTSGLIKSFVFGLIVAYSGCYRGMRATRSATGVGEATTAAVVMGILLIIVADAIFTIMFNVLGI